MISLRTFLQKKRLDNFTLMEKKEYPKDIRKDAFLGTLKISTPGEAKLLRVMGRSDKRWKPEATLLDGESNLTFESECMAGRKYD